MPWGWIAFAGVLLLYGRERRLRLGAAPGVSPGAALGGMVVDVGAGAAGAFATAVDALGAPLRAVSTFQVSRQGEPNGSLVQLPIRDLT